MYETENPIAIQSKNWLVDALLKLMEEKPYKKITIQELADYAQLDRRTFYRNFESKEDILNYYITALSEEYVIALLRNESITIPICLREFFELADKNKNFVLLLRNNDLLMFLLNKLNELLPSIHDLVEDRFTYGFDAIDNEGIGYIFAFNIGGFWNILIKWINEGFDKTPKEIASIVNKLMINQQNPL